VASRSTFPISQILPRLVSALRTCLLTVLSGRGSSASPGDIFVHWPPRCTVSDIGELRRSISRHPTATSFRLFTPGRSHLVSRVIFHRLLGAVASIVRICGVDSSLHRSWQSPTNFLGNNWSMILAQLLSDRINYAID
jgi:hypothetical protein